MTVLIRPIITEKSLRLAGTRQYTFEVDRRANAIEISRAVSEIYRVTITSVRTINRAGVIRHFRRGQGRTRSWKKAIVTVGKGGKIPGFELESEVPEKKADSKNVKKPERSTEKGSA